jgi:hypothetical protein
MSSRMPFSNIITNSRDRRFFELYVQRPEIISRRRGITIPHPMTSAEKQAFLAGIRLKTNWELGRLRVLHPGLQDHELIFKAHKAIVDHWFEFEKSSDPRRKIVESHLIEKFFEDCKKQLAEKVEGDDNQEGHQENGGNVNVEGDGGN